MNHPKLYAPAAYWTLDAVARKALTNGCGPGGWLAKAIPDTIWGLSVHDACDIHDYMYAVGLTPADKEEADRVFLNNMIRIIDANTENKVMLRLRYRRARIYYEFVEHFGGPIFWMAKNPPETMGSLVLA